MKLIPPASMPLLLLALGLANPAQAHFPIFIHDADLAATNGPVTVTFASGHPFELELEPVARPESVRWFDRRGRSTEVTDALEATLFRGDADGGGWRFVFDPPPGDILLALDSAATTDAKHQTLYREYVKLWLHRGRQEGWHQRTGQPLEIVPLTRPYGFRPGMIFTGRLLTKNRPVADTEVYLERLSDRRPDAGALPPEPLSTFAVRTDSDGRFAVTLSQPGWWVVGAYVQDLGPVQHEGQTWQLEAFAGAWVHVDEWSRP